MSCLPSASIADLNHHTWYVSFFKMGTLYSSGMLSTHCMWPMLAANSQRSSCCFSLPSSEIIGVYHHIHLSGLHSSVCMYILLCICVYVCVCMCACMHECVCVCVAGYETLCYVRTCKCSTTEFSPPPPPPQRPSVCFKFVICF